VPHEGPGVVEALRARGYEVVLDRWVTLKHSVFKPRLANPGDGFWALAVASQFPVVARRHLHLPRTVADPAHPRVAIQVSLDVDGTRVEAVGLHTSSRLWWAAPFVHLASLRRQTRDLLHRGPALLAGDFNLWGPGVERILPGWRRAVVGRTYPSHRPHSQIDHILVNDAITPVAGEVVDDRHSDHRPIRASLRA
jgi:endonuclease/exonuclease/phosphatase (EEP) superfamily protein YafD